VVTRTLTLLLFLTLSASAQTPRIPPPENINRNGLVGRWLVPGYQTGNGLAPTSYRNFMAGGLTGTPAVGTPTYLSLFGRPAVKFIRGSPSVVEVPADSSHGFGTNSFTIAVWSCPASFASGSSDANVILNRGGGAPDYEFFYYLSSGVTAVYFGKVGGGLHGLVLGGMPPVNKWEHLAAVYRSGVGLTLYRNGSAVAFTNVAVATSNASSKLYFGGRGYSLYFDGGLADSRLYSRALTPAEIALIYRGLQ
jgi:hypothetical protein